MSNELLQEKKMDSDVERYANRFEQAGWHKVWSTNQGVLLSKPVCKPVIEDSKKDNQSSSKDAD